MVELAPEVLAGLSTADRVESRLGTLKFTDGAPAAKTVEMLYDHLDFVHALNAFLTAFPAASTQALREGFLSIGAQDNTVVIFSELMDSSSRFLTANADTVYYVGIIDLTDGPMVVETPPMALGTFDDMWFQWIIDFGVPGPDRGAGGRFLLVPPGMTGRCPKAVSMLGTRARTGSCCWAGRSCKTTIPRRRWRPSSPPSSYIPTPRVVRAPASLLSWRAPCPSRRRRARCPRPGSWRQAA
jgi:hypothetical protein